MRKDQFFRLRASLMANDHIIRLIEKEQIAGFGIYMALLIELRLRDNYRINRTSLPALARRWDITIDQLERVIDQYKLFEQTEVDGEILFGSPYLDEVMVELEEKWRLQSAAGKRRAATAERTPEGHFTSSHQPIEKKRIKKNTTSTDDDEGHNRGGSSSTLQPFIGWEACVDEAFGEQTWLEVQAMHSGLGMRLMEQRDRIVTAFKQHIRTYGKETAILSAGEAKSYFSNFVRPGTPTRQRLDKLLNRQEALTAEQDIYRFEQHDPLTGERSYYGMPIPKEAPPRPNANSIWEECNKHWI